MIFSRSLSLTQGGAQVIPLQKRERNALRRRALGKSRLQRTVAILQGLPLLLPKPPVGVERTGRQSASLEREGIGALFGGKLENRALQTAMEDVVFFSPTKELPVVVSANVSKHGGRV